MPWLFSCDLSMSFEELVFCLALGPSLTLTTHSGLRIGMLSCFSVRLRLWDAGLTWPEWDITQNMNLPIIMFIPHVHVCVQGHDHVCTSLDEHEIHSNRERSHSKIWFSIYWNARISISHDSKNKKYTRVINFGCWQVTCHQSEFVKYYPIPKSPDICSLHQASQKQQCREATIFDSYLAVNIWQF